MKDNGHAEKKTHGWIIYIMFSLLVGGTSHGSSWLRRNDFLKITK
jgi:hypothetical protein